MPDRPPRISCLMVTQPCPERFALFQRSVACFRAQTYPERELVVVLDEGPAEWVARVRAHLATVPGGAVVVGPGGMRTLGALRNRSVAAASGEVVCQWDDDDLSHPTRLAEQYALLRREDALGVGIEEVFHLFLHDRQLYWTTYRNTPNGFHCPTLMYRRSAAARCPEEGPESRLGEDIALLRDLRREGRLVAVGGAAHLYVYVYHGHNTDADRHRKLVGWLGLSRGLLERRRAVFERLDCFDLGEGPLAVMGTNGRAFEIPGRAISGG